MPAHPEDPMTTSNSKYTRPRNFDPRPRDAVGSRSDLRAVPRYVPSARAQSSTSDYFGASPPRSEYVISSRLGSRHRDEDIISLSGRRGFMECQPRDRATAASTSSLPPTTQHKGQDGAQESDELEETWTSLVALFECIGFRTPSTARQSPPLSSSDGLRQRPAGRPSGSGRPDAHQSNRGIGSNQGRGANNSGDRLPPTDERNDAGDQQTGDGDKDLGSKYNKKSSYQRLFACPFHKFDPVLYAACHDKKFQDIDSVLRHHIKGIHKKKNHISKKMHERLRQDKLGRREPTSRWKAIYSALFGQDLPETISPYWTPARYTRDFEDNVSDIVEAVISHADTLEEVLQRLDYFMSDFDAEILQAQTRRERVRAEGMRRLEQLRDQECALANPDNSMQGPFSPESAYGGMLQTPESIPRTPRSDIRQENPYYEMQVAPAMNICPLQAEFPQGRDHTGMPLLPRMQPTAAGLDHGNQRYPMAEHREPSTTPDTIDLLCSRGMFFNTPIPGAVPGIHDWNNPGVMNAVNFMETGSQNQDQNQNPTIGAYCQPGHSIMLPTRRQSVRRHNSSDSRDSGYSSGAQGGRPRCPLHSEWPAATYAVCTLEGGICTGEDDVHVTG